MFLRRWLGMPVVGVVLIIIVGACGATPESGAPPDQPTAPVGDPAQHAEDIVLALIQDDTATVQALVGDQLPNRDLDITDKIRQWGNLQAGVAGACSAATATPPTTQGATIRVQVRVTCATVDQGMELDFAADNPTVVVAWRIIHPSELEPTPAA